MLSPFDTCEVFVAPFGVFTREGVEDIVSEPEGIRGGWMGEGLGVAGGCDWAYEETGEFCGCAQKVYREAKKGFESRIGDHSIILTFVSFEAHFLTN